MSCFDITTAQRESFHCCEFVISQLWIILSSFNLPFQNILFNLVSGFCGNTRVSQIQDVGDETEMEVENQNKSKPVYAEFNKIENSP